jgi:hypothetical protein
MTCQSRMPIHLPELPEQPPVYAFYADLPPYYDKEMAFEDLKALTPEQRAELRAGTWAGIALVASSNEADQEFEKASAAASIAVRNIDTMFDTLTVELTSLGDMQEFLDMITTIKKVSIYSLTYYEFSFTVHRFSATL